MERKVESAILLEQGIWVASCFFSTLDRRKCMNVLRGSLSEKVGRCCYSDRKPPTGAEGDPNWKAVALTV